MALILTAPDLLVIGITLLVFGVILIAIAFVALIVAGARAAARHGMFLG